MKQDWRAVGNFGTLGLEVVLCIGAGFFGGRWLDGKLGTDPWLSLVGFGFGVAAAVNAFRRALKEMQAEAAREEREQGNPAPVWEKAEDRLEELDELEEAKRRLDARLAKEQEEAGGAPKSGGPKPE